MNETSGEVIPAHLETGRYTRGTSEFTVHLEPDNHGALLRRAIDYGFPNQKAEIYVADASDAFDPENPKWEYVGIWYTPGSNTCLFSPADGELGRRKYEVQTSNRRFRDEEFLIPAKYAKNRSAIRIRVKHVAEDRELYPGHPYPEKSAWTELRYEVFSYIMPRFSMPENH